MCTCNDMHVNVIRSDEIHTICEPDISLFRKVQIVGISILYLGHDIVSNKSPELQKYKNRLHLI